MKFVPIRRHQSGQTLVIALLTLGVLLALGTAFVLIVSRNIDQTTAARQRTNSTDLAQAGIRFAHYQLVNSALGADWRPESTGAAIDPATGFSRDPDALYLRPGSGFVLRGSVIDRGGPDGLGPFTRLNYERGRALIRVRYAPADFDAFATGTGQLRQVGKTRNYIVIESVGKAGRVDLNDPSTLLRDGRQVTNFANRNEFLSEFGRLQNEETQKGAVTKQIGLASIGFIEQARFITNKFRVSTAAEIGSPTVPNSAGAGQPGGLGVTYEGQEVRLFSSLGLVNPGASTINSIGAGSLYSNADLLVHGETNVILNPARGDLWAVAGNIRPANDASALTISIPNPTTGTLDSTRLAAGNLDSRNDAFTTLNGVLRDGVQDVDDRGYTRSAPRKEPPSILSIDPTTRQNRYVVMTRESGPVFNGRNIGNFGWGQGIYVSGSAADRAVASDEGQRQRVGASRSLPQHWLNPTNQSFGLLGSWIGPYFVPQAAYLRLLPDGFEITRESRTNNQGFRTNNFWRRPDGSDSGQSTVRFRLRKINNGGRIETFAINSLLNPNLIGRAASNLADSDFLTQGRRFNGVVLFETDVRVRGVIPTDEQLTVVSFGSVYIEGSITKGIVDESGSVLGRPSRSMLALMAKDYVCINTTQFFGLAPGEQPNTKDNSTIQESQVPLEVDLSSSSLTLQNQFLLNSAENAVDGIVANNPSTWVPFATTYREHGSNNPLPSRLMVMHSADGGESFISLEVQARAYLAGGAGANYLFPSYRQQAAEFPESFNEEIRDFLLPAGTNKVFSPIYGLANGSRNWFTRFENLALPLADATSAIAGRVITGGGDPNRPYRLALQDETEFTVRLTGFEQFSTRNYLHARMGVNPNDVRIEAALFAEEGSFFVIPGLPYNLNQDDTRERFQNDVNSFGITVAQQRRWENYGAMPETPFYGEPLNTRIVISGAVAENMPAPMSQQAEWQRQWGWMPRFIGGTGRFLPDQHVPNGLNIRGNGPNDPRVAPNLIISYDRSLALGTADGAAPIRTSDDGQWVLPPLPRLPVSPNLIYFGEVNP